jgi:hypothetical protein
MKNDKAILSKDEMYAYDPKYGKRYQALHSDSGNGCRKCQTRQGGRLCMQLPCSCNSEFKPVRKDGFSMIWIPKQPEIQK